MKNHPAGSDDEDDSNSLQSAPDGGFGWVIVFSAFMTSLFVDGIIFSFGILLPEILFEFQAGQSETAWVGSALAGTYLMIGPVTSALANRYGCRPVAIAGSIISTGAFICASFADSVAYLIVTYGVIGGIGFGFIYLPSLVMVQMYFEKRRAFATGIAVCGSGIGMFIFSPLTQLLIEHYGWRGMLLIQSAISLHCAAFSGFFRPIALRKKAKRKKLKPLLIRTKEARDALNRLSIMTIDDEEMRDIKVPIEQQKTIVNNNENYSRIQSMERINRKNSSVKIENERNRLPSNYDVDFEKKKSFCSCIEFPSWRSLPARPILPRVTAADLSKPFYRSDIFFSGSLLRIPDYDSNAMYKNESMESVDGSESEEEDRSFGKVFAMMLDLSILKSPTFIVIVIGAFLSFMGFFTPFVYISDFAISQGVEKDKAAILLSIIGIANTAGRIVCGWISDHPHVQALHVNNGALVVAGVTTSLVPFCHSYLLQSIYCTVFGLAIACFVSLRSILIVEFMGLAKLTNAFGLMLLFQGSASMIGPPIAGWFYKQSDSYDMSFYVAGSILALSGLICIPLPAISTWENKKLVEESEEKRVEETKELCDEFSTLNKNDETRFKMENRDDP